MRDHSGFAESGGILHIDSSRDYITAQVENSLRQLGVDCLDVLLLHRPDPLMQADEVAATFVALRAAGKVKAFGTSNFSISQFTLLQSRLPFPLVLNQIELSILQTGSLRDGLLDHMQQQHRLPVMAWSPLADGRLLVGDDVDASSVRPILLRLAAQYGVDSAAIAIAWVMRLPGTVLPVLGSSSPARLRRVADAAKVPLERQDWFEIYTSLGNTVG